ncbi:MAG TPA: response regulator [Bacteroidales bacterium]|nr:response regulator [Bacteroidales bacterium]HPS62501.1 response regulator [Bacteroidales bacterium]
MESYDAVEILIVEDNPHDAELTQRALKKGNLANNVFIVEDGEEALDFLYSRGKFAQRNRSKALRVVFLDLKLPKISGLEVLKAIKSTESTRLIPVVIITSSKEDPDIRQAYELGANSYVVKPVDFDSFMEAIKTTGLFWLSINIPPVQFH